MSATNLRLALIGALLICYVLASLAEAWAGNGIAGLETEVRGRIRERIRQWTWYLRAMDVVGVLLLLVALARLAGLLSDVLPSLGEWALGLGVGFLCAERVLRAWNVWRAFLGEPAAQMVHRRALAAAAVVTLSQVLLAGLICWWAFFRSYRAGAEPGEEAPAPFLPEQELPGEQRQRQWVHESEALRLLGKDAAYLELLAAHDDAAVKRTANGIFYDRRWLEFRRQAELPSLEDLRESAPKAKAEKDP
jgi:hypothetical protein